MNRQSQFGSQKDGCFLFRWLQLYSFINYFRSLWRPLQNSDMFNLSSDLYPENNVQYYRQRRRAVERLTLGCFIYKNMLLLACILATVGASLTFAGPIVIRQIIDLLKSVKAVTEAEKWSAYKSVGLWIVLYLLRIFFNEYADRLTFIEATRAEQIVTIEVLEKIGRLSPIYKRTGLLNYFINDIKLIFGTCKCIVGIVSSVATLALVQTFLLLKVGIAAMVLIVVFIVIGIAQVALHKKMSNTRVSKMELVCQRIARYIEFFSKIKDIKLLGWERLIVEKDRQYRPRVDQLNYKYFLYSNLFDLVINLTPTLVVSSLLITQSLQNHRFRFEIGDVYSILAFAGLTYGPAKILLSSITGVVDGYSSLRRVEELLSKEQYRSLDRHEDVALQKGSVVIEDLEGSYNPERVNQLDFLQEPAEHREGVQNLLSRKSLFEDDDEKQPIEGFVVRVPFKVEVKRGDKLILLGEANAGKTELIQSILGNLRIEGGRIAYNGRIGYMPQKIWLLNDTVRNNILFGQAYDPKKLSEVYKLLEFDRELQLFAKADQTVLSETTNISEAQKRRIALARVLYSQPDILLLDEAFASLDQQTVVRLYSNFCNDCRDRTIILSTHLTSFIRGTDRVLLMKQGEAVECDLYNNLLDNPDSEIHKLLDEKAFLPFDRVWLAKQKKFERRQRVQRYRKRMLLKKRVRVFLKSLIALTKNLRRQELDKLLKVPSGTVRAICSETSSSKRVEPVSLVYYWRFLRTAPLWLYVLLFLLAVGAQSLKMYSDVWLGGLIQVPYNMDDRSALLKFIGMTISLVVLLAIGGTLSPFISLMNSKKIGKQLQLALAYAQLSWFQKTTTTKAATRLGRDSEQIFQVNSTVQNLLKTGLMFLVSMAMFAFESSSFVLFAVGIALFNVIILITFMRAERQMKALGALHNPPILQAFNYTITGIDSLRAFDKVGWCHSNIHRDLYNSTVWKWNYKFLYTGMSIMCELTSLFIIGVAAVLAVGSKFNKLFEDVVLISASITFSLRLTGAMSSIVKDCIGLEQTMKGSSKKNFHVIDSNPLNRRIIKPKGWPRDNSIEFDNITLGFEADELPIVKSLDLKVASGENVVICGRDGSGKSSLLSAACRLLKPMKNVDGSTGCIRIGGEDISKISSQQLHEHVLLLGTVPFLYTASLRENVDPFKKYGDKEIEECLKKVELWDEIKPKAIIPKSREAETKAKLAYELTDAGSQLNIGSQQKLNVARALLRKPNILLLESATSCMDEFTEEEVLRVLKQALKSTTILMVTQQLDTTIESNRVVYMAHGRIKQIGVPMELLKNPDSSLAVLVKAATPNLYIKKILSRDSQTSDKEVRQLRRRSQKEQATAIPQERLQFNQLFPAKDKPLQTDRLLCDTRRQ